MGWIEILLVAVLAGSPAWGDSGSPVKVEDRTPKVAGFPCSECHGKYKSAGPWQKEHKDLVFQHMDNEKRCLLCHSSSDTNRLVLLDGTKVPFSDSPRLCGQCHGLKYRDWSAGLHGKTLGKGSASAERLACTSCHEPHNPKFKKMMALPAPHHPKFLIEKREEEDGSKPANSGQKD
jgi:Cytochrome c7 and related cytochrome c